MAPEKNIVDFLKGIGEDESIPETPIKRVAGREIVTRQDEVEAAFDLKMRGLSTATIAEILHRSQETVRNYFKEYIESYKNSLERETPLNLISDTVLFYEKLKEICLLEASQATKGEELKEKLSNRKNNPEKLNWIKMAHDTELSKIKLLIDAGIIPKDPDKIYAVLKNDKEAEKLSEASRSPEVVKENIAKLMKRVKIVGQ